jgi:hypothetical protein
MTVSMWELCLCLLILITSPAICPFLTALTLSISMTLQKHTISVDGTIPVTALLYNDEENYASQDGVGIYDG